LRYITYITYYHLYTHPFNGPLSGTTQVSSRYQKGKTSLDFTEARDSEWQWHQLGCVQVCTLLQTDNHTSIPPLSFLQAGCPSCRPTNSVKALFISRVLFSPPSPTSELRDCQLCGVVVNRLQIVIMDTSRLYGSWSASVRSYRILM